MPTTVELRAGRCSCCQQMVTIGPRITIPDGTDELRKWSCQNHNFAGYICAGSGWPPTDVTEPLTSEQVAEIRRNVEHP